MMKAQKSVKLNNSKCVLSKSPSIHVIETRKKPKLEQITASIIGYGQRSNVVQKDCIKQVKKIPAQAVELKPVATQNNITAREEKQKPLTLVKMPCLASRWLHAVIPLHFFCWSLCLQPAPRFDYLLPLFNTIWSLNAAYVDQQDLQMYQQNSV